MQMTDIEEDDELPDAFDAESADDSSLESPAMAAAPSFPARGRKGGDSPYRTEIRGRRTVSDTCLDKLARYCMHLYIVAMPCYCCPVKSLCKPVYSLL